MPRRPVITGAATLADETRQSGHRGQIIPGKGFDPGRDYGSGSRDAERRRTQRSASR